MKLRWFLEISSYGPRSYLGVSDGRVEASICYDQNRISGDWVFIVSSRDGYLGEFDSFMGALEEVQCYLDFRESLTVGERGECLLFFDGEPRFVKQA